MQAQTDEDSPAKNAQLLRGLTTCGVLLVVGYIGFFAVMESGVFYYANKPDPIQTRLHTAFDPITNLFPWLWLNVNRRDSAALVLVPPFLAVIGIIVGVPIYAFRQVSKANAWRQEYIRPAVTKIFAFTVVILLVLLCVRGLLTTDIYSYVWYSRVWVEHGASPYTHFPAEFAAQDTGHWLDWVYWKNEPAVYGPVWLYISGALYKLGQLGNGQFATQLLVLRALADAAHLVNAWLVWRIAGLMVKRREPAARGTAKPIFRPRALSRGRWHRLAHVAQASRTSTTATTAEDNGLGFQIGALIFYIWNPLLLVEFGGNGHNDAVMLTFVLLAFWLHLLGKWRLAALALGLATLVKLVAILFLPGYLWLLLWEGYRAAGGQNLLGRFAKGIWRGAQAVIIIALAWVVLYIPFWEGPQTLAVLLSGPANRWYLHSLGELGLQHVPSFVANVAPSFGVQDTGPAFTDQVRIFLDANLKVGMMFVAVIVAGIVTWKARTFERAVTAWGWVVFVAIVMQAWFWPWYTSWMVAPATLSSARRLRIATLVFCTSSLLHYIEESVLQVHFKIFRDLSGAFVMGPPLIYLLCSWLVQVTRNRSSTKQASREVVREQSVVAHAG
ncbi:MAG: alpha,6-mannosyltransferase [Chloroflexia bacterium]|jgi:hypothetical protein|nr:alpha,6-mannosyltransferase [Chloroflexia bacterium]